jgi:hypothetical protein
VGINGISAWDMLGAIGVKNDFENKLPCAKMKILKLLWCVSRTTVRVGATDHAYHSHLVCTTMGVGARPCAVCRVPERRFSIFLKSQIIETQIQCGLIFIFFSKNTTILLRMLRCKEKDNRWRRIIFLSVVVYLFW